MLLRLRDTCDATNVNVMILQKVFIMKNLRRNVAASQRPCGEDLRRDVFVGTVIEWLGEVRPKDLIEAFGVSGPTATRILADWSLRHPGQATHRKGEHGYRKAGPASAPQDGGGLLRFMRGQALADELAPGCALSIGVEMADVDALTEAPVGGDVLGCFLRAIHRKRCVAIRYAGRRAVREMVLSPTRLVHALGRYHVRALDHLDDTFKDIVLSRVVAVHETAEERRSMQDREWERSVVLSFQLNPELEPEMRMSVANEWGIDGGGVHKIRCREALALYVVRRMTAPTISGRPRWRAFDAATRAVARKPQRRHEGDGE